MSGFLRQNRIQPAKEVPWTHLSWWNTKPDEDDNSYIFLISGLLTLRERDLYMRAWKWSSEACDMNPGTERTRWDAGGQKEVKYFDIFQLCIFFVQLTNITMLCISWAAFKRKWDSSLSGLLMSFPWHLPSISRLRAEELLLNSGKNGAFIIRDSESISNVHVLCLL